MVSKGQLSDTGKQFFFRLTLAKQLIDGFSSRSRQTKRGFSTSEESFAKLNCSYQTMQVAFCNTKVLLVAPENEPVPGVRGNNTVSILRAEFAKPSRAVPRVTSISTAMLAFKDIMMKFSSRLKSH